MDTRIQGQQGNALQRTQGAIQLGDVTGNFRGTQVKLHTVTDLDDVNQAKRLLVARGVEDVPKQTLAQRTIGADIKPIQLSNMQLNRIADSYSGRIAITKLASEYLQSLINKGSKPEQHETLDSVMQHFAALKMLVSATRSGLQDFIAKMTPVPEGNGSLKELATKLQEANDDPQKLKVLLAEVSGLPSDGDQLFQMMKTLRFNPDELADLLREKQGLPALDKGQLQELAEKAEDLLKDLEGTHGSRIKADINALESGQQLMKPAAFAEIYVDVLHGIKRFTSLLQHLLEKHEPRTIPKVIAQLEQTLGDEIRLDQEMRSFDIAKLEAIHIDLSLMHISNTLLEKLSRLTTGLNRVFGEPSTAA